MSFFFFFFFLFFLSFLKSRIHAEVTGDHITIHIVAHTHDDVGWLITVDEYYIQEVQWILDTMIPVLLDNPQRKFSYVEQAYFSRWWNEQTDSTRANVRTLVNNRQLQFNLGGWAMNDEASPTLSEVVRQMTDGQQFILRQFGNNGRPTVGWHIDPFGHSYVTGGMWSEVGFDAFAMWRINYRQQDQRQQQQNLEFMWKGSSSLGDNGYIWVHLLEDSGYCAPNEIAFYWSTFIQTDPRLPSLPTNYVQLAESLINDARTRRAWYRHEHILMPFGCDFAHQNAYQSMTQMDKLIAYINSNSTYNTTIMYSSFAEYVHAVNALNLTWDVETNDFFSYDDGPHAWWTGYFTSRPKMKEYIRSRENILRPAEQWFAFAKNMNFFNLYANIFNTTAIMNNITYLRNAVDSAQHHDGISGTSTQSTTEDFMYMLQQGTERVAPFMEQVAPYFLKKGSNVPNLAQDESLISSLTDNNVLVVVLYNSLAWSVTEIIQVPSNTSNLLVYNSMGQQILSQINPLTIYAQPFSVPCEYILFFEATLPPLSFSTFFVKLTDDISKVNLGKIRYADDAMDANNEYSIGTGYYSLTFTQDQQTKGTYLTGLYNSGLRQSFVLNNTWIQYIPTGGIYSDGLQTSGHYIFRPAQDNRYTLSSSNSLTVIDTLAFREPFTSPQPSPGFIIATHAGGQYDDTFIATVCSYELSVGNFTYRYHRVDAGSYWGQTPSLDFLIFDNDNSNEFLHFDAGQAKYGSISVPASSTQIGKASIVFPSGFYSQPPSLAVSVRGTNCGSGASYIATVTSITNQGASVSIARVDKASSWNENVYLDWFSWNPSDSNPTELFTTGKVQFTIPSGTKQVTKINFTFSNTTDFVVNEPVVLYSLRQVTPDPSSGGIFYVATTTVYNGKKGFGFNIFPMTSITSSVTYEVSYLAFERKILYKDIDPPQVTFVEGPLVSEAQQVWKANYSQTYRVFNSNNTNDLRYVDAQVHLGPMDQGAEFVSRWTTTLDSNGTMYTCQSALEYIKRIYQPNLDERVGANYYPSSSQVYISDSGDELRFATIVNQAHGTATLRSGEIELMLHRRTLTNDGRGPDEPLNETTHIESRIYLVYDTSEEVSFLSRRLYERQHYGPTKFYALSSSISSWLSNYNVEWTAMYTNTTQGLPPNIHLQDLRYAYNGVDYNQGLILQLQHMFEVNENPQWSVNETIDVSEIFSPNALPIEEVTEMTLTASLPLADLHRLQWTIMEDGEVRTLNTKQDPATGTLVNISPRQIRTFIVNQQINN